MNLCRSETLQAGGQSLRRATEVALHSASAAPLCATRGASTRIQQLEKHSQGGLFFTTQPVSHDPSTISHTDTVGTTPTLIRNS